MKAINLPTSLHSPNNQKGAVLIVALILLVVLTMLGISAIEATKLETRMTSNTIQHNESFQAVEAGLVTAGLDLNRTTQKILTIPPTGAAKYRVELPTPELVGNKRVKSTTEDYVFFRLKSISYLINSDGGTERLTHELESVIEVAVPKSNVFQN